MHDMTQSKYPIDNAFRNCSYRGSITQYNCRHNVRTKIQSSTDPNLTRTQTITLNIKITQLICRMKYKQYSYYRLINPNKITQLTQNQRSNVYKTPR